MRRTPCLLLCALSIGSAAGADVAARPACSDAQSSADCSASCDVSFTAGAAGRKSDAMLSLGRIRVHVDYRNQYNGQTGVGSALVQNDEFAYFYFTEPSNPEVFVKVLGANSPQYIQVFVGGLTDLQYSATFTGCGGTVRFDKPAGAVSGYVNGAAFLLSRCSSGERPNASFSYSPSTPQPSQTVSFFDTSSASPTSWTWFFGDGGFSNSRNPTHAYSASGDYRVDLTATNAAGSGSTSRTVSVRTQNTTKTLRVTLTNRLVWDATVSVDGVPLYTYQAGQTATFNVQTNADQTRVELISNPARYNTGQTVAGSGQVQMYWDLTVVDGGATSIQSGVYFANNDTYYFAPLLRNLTSTRLTPAVNYGLQSQYIFPGVVLPGGGYTFIGYYRLFSNSNVRYWTENRPPPQYGYWYYDNFTGAWNDADGAIRFDMQNVPSLTGGELDDALASQPAASCVPEPRLAPWPEPLEPDWIGWVRARAGDVTPLLADPTPLP